ncbi:MAG: GNAT family N-acetyltransferase [Bacteroidetes bacterium]|nr:GNAT family N-acetyltransferase [Bacteroidota bacterium]
MNILLYTSRLLLRELNENDAPFIVELLNTEGWLRYIGDRHVHSTADAIKYMNNGPVISYQKYGYGLYLVALKETQTPVGICGLIRSDHWEETDIGFAFLPQFTGKGYAMEAAAAVLADGKERHHLERIIAITLEENKASIRLLEKLGLSYEKRIIYENTGEELLQYAIQFHPGSEVS